MVVRFVTGNAAKVSEVREYLSGVTETVEQVQYDYLELQSDDITEIAIHGAQDAFETLSGEEPVIVDDTGLFVDVLNGFPGPYAAYVQQTVGIESVANLVGDVELPKATFRTVIAYHDGDTTETFDGVLRGRIVSPRGDGGFGYDPIFEYDGRTLAERSTREKNAISHRGRAVAKFADWLADEPAERKGVR